MARVNYTTEERMRRPLSKDEKGTLGALLRAGWSIDEIAYELFRVPELIEQEVKNGKLLHGPAGR